MEEDVSKRTITILVILTVVISILGTLSVMSAMNDIKTQKRAESDPGEGEVSLNIINDGDQGQEEMQTSSPTTGKITLEITESSEEKEEDPRILLLPESSET